MPLIVLTGYLVGSVPFAWLLARRWGTDDLRRVGSGNLGAANVLRATGITPGVLVAALDIAKGAASVAIARRMSADESSVAMAGFAAILGHIYPVWFHFHGGKGVATACGVFSVLTPLAVPPAIAAFLITVWVTKYVSVGSVVASLALPTIAFAVSDPAPALAAACAAAGIIIFRHRSNLARVRTGTERRLGASV